MSTDKVISFELDDGLAQTLLEASLEDLAALADLGKDDEDDSQAELSTAACFELFSRTQTQVNFEHLVTQAEKWLNTIETGDPDHARRSRVLEKIRKVQDVSDADSAVLQIGKDNRSVWPKFALQVQRPTNSRMCLRSATISSKITKLDEAIEDAETKVRTLGLPNSKSNLSGLLCRRFVVRQEHQDVHRAVELSRQAIESTDDTDGYWAVIVKNYASSLGLRHEITEGGSRDDLSVGIELLKMVLFPAEQSPQAPSPIPISLRPLFLIDLGNMFEARSCLQETLDASDIEEAIVMQAKALLLTDKNDQHRLTRLETLRRRLEARIACPDTTSASDFAPKRDSSGHEIHRQPWFARLDRIVDDYITHILASSEHISLACFDQAIQLSELIETQTHTLADQNNQHVTHWLSRRTFLHAARSDRTQSITDLDDAIHLQMKALNLRSQQPNCQGPVLDLLSDLHLHRFKKSSSASREDLELSAFFDLKASTCDFKFATSYLLRSSKRLDELARCFLDSFRRTKSSRDVERAVELADLAYSKVPQQSPDALPVMQTLALSLDERSRLGLGDPPSDSSRAFEIMSVVMERTPKDHRVMVERMMNLEKILEQHYKTKGSPENVNHAIALLTDLMGRARAPPGHPIHRLLRQSIAPWLRYRATMTNSTADLAQATKILEDATTLPNEEDSIRSDSYNNFAIALMHDFGRSNDVKTLNRSIESVTKAINFTPEGSSKMDRRRSLLAGLLSHRWHINRVPQDLEDSIDMAELSLRNWRQLSNGLLSAELLANLGLIIQQRSKEVFPGFVSDLDYAAELFEAAIEAGGQSYRFRASMLDRLLSIITLRLRVDKVLDISLPAEHVPAHFRKVQRVLHQPSRTISSADLTRALSMGSGTLNMASSPILDRLDLAIRISKTHAENFQWHEADLVAQQALMLLPSISPRSLDNKEGSVARFAGLAASAVSFRLESQGSGDDALQCSERGRGIINGLLFETRSDISALGQEYPKLASDFTSARDRLESLTAAQRSGVETYDPQAEQRASILRDAEAAFNDKLAEIRSLPNFSHFLAAPSTEDIIVAGNPDPIAVINVSEYRCDALVVHNGKVNVIELLDLNIADARAWASKLPSLVKSPLFSIISPLLEWLWRVVCSPILDTLGFCRPISGPKWPRIWWIPTGIISRFPLHAAGLHDTPGETVMDRVMSSYASSVRSLIYARSHGAAELSMAKPNTQALLVGMSKTPGFNPLPQAEEEVSMVDRLFQSMELETFALNSEAKKSEVLEKLANCNIFHFAGHGSADGENPSDSKLLLQDWTKDALHLHDLRDHQFMGKPHFLCYLSACSTGVTVVDQLSDEGMHFISAFQMAGFRHVIGTLWSVYDDACLHLAKAFYESLVSKPMTDQTVCEAFHHAVRKLRDIQIEGLLFNKKTLDETLEKGKGKAKATDVSQKEKVSDTLFNEGDDKNRAVLNSVAYLKADGTGFKIVYTSDQSVPTQGRQQGFQGRSQWVPFIHYGA